MHESRRSSEMVERGAVAKIWPRSVADSQAEYLTPRQIEMLYASSDWAYEAVSELERLADLLARGSRLGMTGADRANWLIETREYLAKIGGDS
jgi:hypothetical protein